MSNFNTAAGWVLAGGIVALGASIVTSEIWHAERPEEMGYVVEGVVEESGDEDSGPSLAEALNTATAAQGEAVFARCVSCHTINQGGADGIGPNLYGVLGSPIAGVSGFAYSDTLAGMGGSWNFDNMSEWLTRPSAFAQGTKMSFAGLSDVMDRAAVILYMNEQGSNLPIPAPPAADEGEEGSEDDIQIEESTSVNDGDDDITRTEDAIPNEGDAAGSVDLSDE